MHASFIHCCCSQIYELRHIFKGLINYLYVVTVVLQMLSLLCICLQTNLLLTSHGSSVVVTHKQFKQGSHRAQQNKHLWFLLSFSHWAVCSNSAHKNTSCCYRTQKIHCYLKLVPLDSILSLFNPFRVFANDFINNLKPPVYQYII